MSIKKFTPQNSDLFLGKDQGDHMLGKFGHLNYLLKLVNAAALTFSPGSIIFSDGTGNPAADPTQLHWDDANNRLGIGNATPTQALDVTGSIKYSGTLYTPFTTGSIPFAGASGALSQNNSDLFWDNTNARLGIGTVTPSNRIHISENKSGFSALYVTNTNTGPSGGAGALFLNSLGTTALQLIHVGTGNSTNANKSVVRGSGAGLFFNATNYMEFTTGTYPGTRRMMINTNGNVVIGSTADAGYKLDVVGTLKAGDAGVNASAVLSANSTTQGFLPPRMTGAQAEAIASPAEGLMVYSTDGSGTTITSKGWWGYDGATWVKLN